MEQPGKPEKSLLIRSISILLNGIGVCFFIVLFGMLTIHDSDRSLSNILLSAFFTGLAPLIVMTYFLWYLIRPRENLFGILIATPAAIFIHCATMWVAAHATFRGQHLDFFFCTAELVVAILAVIMAIRRGHVRKKE